MTTENTKDAAGAKHRGKRSMLTTILVAVAAVIVLFVIVVATRPTDFSVVRQATMTAAPATVFAQVDNFHNWVPWSPWEKRDPNLKRTYSGPDAGVGAMYAWAGNNQVGAGRMTILESTPGERIRIKLEFLKPFAATNEAVFTFAAQGNQTLVTWTMTGRNNFMAKAMGLFMNMDKMIGTDFEAGLAGIKAIAEKPAAG